VNTPARLDVPDRPILRSGNQRYGSALFLQASLIALSARESSVDDGLTPSCPVHRKHGPVDVEASSEIRKRAAAAISPGAVTSHRVHAAELPDRGLDVGAGLRCVGPLLESRSIGVSTAPGQMALQRMFSFP
jgi:hypothetical protein